MLDIDENIVRMRAYEIWESDGRPEGCETQHWERAVRDLTKAKPIARAKSQSRARKSEAAPAAKPRRKAANAAS